MGDLAVVVVATVALKLGLLWVDPWTRFLFGDSAAYVATGLFAHVPIDRSWSYGLLIEGLRLVWPDTRGIVALNLVVWGAVQVGLAWDLRRQGGRGLLFVGLTSVTPVLLYYERAVLTDMLALAVLVLWCWAVLRRQVWGGAVLAFVLVSLRTAAAPVLLGAIPLLWLTGERRLGRVWAGSVGGVVLYAVVNGMVLHTAPTLNAASSRFTLATLQPALDCPVIRRTYPGFDCALIEAWRLGDLHQRNQNLWRPDSLVAHLRGVAAARGVGEFALDAELVRHAVMDRPGAVAWVLLRTAALYLDPRSYWAEARLEHLDQDETSGDFLDRVVRPVWRTEWSRESTTRVSVARWLITEWQAVEWVWLVVVLAALGGWVSGRGRWVGLDRVFLAVAAVYLAALPVFSVDMVVRYLMPVSLVGIWVVCGKPVIR